MLGCFGLHLAAGEGSPGWLAWLCDAVPCAFPVLSYPAAMDKQGGKKKKKQTAKARKEAEQRRMLEDAAASMNMSLEVGCLVSMNKSTTVATM